MGAFWKALAPVAVAIVIDGDERALLLLLNARAHLAWVEAIHPCRDLGDGLGFVWSA